MTVKDTDLGFKKIKEQLSKFEKLQVWVGFQGNEGQEQAGDSRLTVVDVATFNEFGTQNSPARPFLRKAMDENRDVIGRAFEQAVRDVVDRKVSAVQAAARLGELGVSLVKRKIVSLKDPPNAPATVARKGSSNPLVDTGQLLQSVTYTVREGNRVLRSG